jgi:hypothetical protein
LNKPKKINVNRVKPNQTNQGKGKDKGKVVPVLNYASRHEDVLGEWRYKSMHS